MDKLLSLQEELAELQDIAKTVVENPLVINFSLDELLQLCLDIRQEERGLMTSSLNTILVVPNTQYKH